MSSSSVDGSPGGAAVGSRPCELTGSAAVLATGVAVARTGAGADGIFAAGGGGGWTDGACWVGASGWAGGATAGEGDCVGSGRAPLAGAGAPAGTTDSAAPAAAGAAGAAAASPESALKAFTGERQKGHCESEEEDTSRLRNYTGGGRRASEAGANAPWGMDQRWT